VVTDNGSADGSFEAIKRLIEGRRPSGIRVKLVRLERNYGFAGGVNRGYAARDPDSRYLVLLNNDAVPYPDSLGRMVEVLESNEGLAAAQRVIVRYGNPGVVDSAGGFLDGFLFSHQAFKGLGTSSARRGFDATYAEGSYSVYRVDYLRRALKTGERLFYDFMFAYYDDSYLGLKLWNGGFASLQCHGWWRSTGGARRLEGLGLASSTSLSGTGSL